MIKKREKGGNLFEAVIVCWQAEEINRDDRAWLELAFRKNFDDCIIQPVRIQVKGIGFDVYKDRGCPDEADYLGRSKKRKWSREYRMTLADPQGHQGQLQSIRTVRAGDCVVNADIVGERSLQL